MTPRRRALLIKFINYTYSPIGFDWNELTDAERDRYEKVGGEDAFNSVVAIREGGDIPAEATFYGLWQYAMQPIGYKFESLSDAEQSLFGDKLSYLELSMELNAAVQEAQLAAISRNISELQEALASGFTGIRDGLDEVSRGIDELTEAAEEVFEGRRDPSPIEFEAPASSEA